MSPYMSYILTNDPTMTDLREKYLGVPETQKEKEARIIAMVTERVTEEIRKELKTEKLLMELI